MKVYIHLEEGTPFTVVTLVTPTQTVGQLLEVFSNELNKHHPTNTCQSPSNFILRSGRRVLDNGAVVNRVARSGDDLYVELKPAELPQKTAPPTAAAAEPKKPVMTEEEKELHRRFTEAVKLNKEGRSNEAVGIYKQILKEHPQNTRAHSKLATIYEKAERGEEAVRYARKALESKPDEPLLKFRFAECLLMAKKGEEALEVLKDYARVVRGTAKATRQEKHCLQVAMCRAYRLMDQRDMALAVVQGVLQEDRANLPALVEYAQLTWDLGEQQKEEAAIILINALVNAKGNQNINPIFAKFCKENDGLEYLRKAAGAGLEDVAALMYLANLLRDHGAIKEAKILLLQALEREPNNVNVLLNFVHLLEVLGEHTAGIERIVKYVGENSSNVAVGTLTLGSISKCIKHLEGDIHMFDGVSEEDLTELPLTTGQAVYSNADQYMMALLFTLVKILYVKGALAVLPPIIRLLDPLYRGKNLHLTAIRNEAAYYGCISQMFEEIPPSMPINKEGPFVYVVGDSHCISPAWRQINYSGQQHTIHPMLSTGTKIWHLRPESEFYPKINFFNVIKDIPDGSTVILLLGEIDCRESLFACVEKCKYERIEDGIDHVIKVYMKVLSELHRQHHYTLYVHPVPPVIGITRALVTSFNDRLKSKLATSKIAKWLPLLDLMVEEGGNKLRDEFRFDGTHIHPKYVTKMESALQKLAS